MIKRLLFVMAVVVSTPLAAQQFAFELWHEGKLVLDSSDTLRGYIKYDLQNDLLQFKSGTQLGSFSARKAVSFEIFDNTVKRYRQFYSLPYSNASQYKTPVFFELLSEGKITLLCREKLEYRTYSSPFNYYGGYSTRLVMVYKFFLLRDNGNIDDFNGKKSDWLDMMGGRAEDVSKYAKENKLDFDDKYDLTRIIEYYNSFFAKK